MTELGAIHLKTPELAARAAGLRALGVLSAGDLALVDLVAPRFEETDPEVLIGLALALRAPRAGHVGVDLRTVREQTGDELSPSEVALKVDPDAAWPNDPVAWESAVLASPLVGAAPRPFVAQPLGKGRRLIMTRRMWREQERLADALLELASTAPGLILDAAAVQNGVMRLFPKAGAEAAQAVRTVARRRLTVVTGGPGTGKTYSIKRVLALLMEAAPADRPLRIELAAPTGKAAVRMAEAIAEKLQELDVSDAVCAQLSSMQPRTLHKLLDLRSDGQCHYGLDRRLPADLVVVDEASMIDVTLFRQLCEALGEEARLVLLGDRDQLASVEAGTVLADIVTGVLDSAESSNSPLVHAIVPFRTNYRSANAPTVAAIAKALQDAGPEAPRQVRRWMLSEDSVPKETMTDRVTYIGRPNEQGRPTDAQVDALMAPYLAEDGVVGLLASALRRHGSRGAELQAPDFHLELLTALERYRVLAVHRRGPLGVSGLDRGLTQRCQTALKVAIRVHRGLPPEAAVQLPRQLGLFLGQPVMVTRNAYDVQLMNGDIGLILPTGGGLAAVFPVTNGDERTCRAVALSRLPEHESAFCMTVHKSQGSQFANVAMVLAGRDSPIQTRELIYTAITRTSSRLRWLGDPDELERALARPVARASGLSALLWPEE